MNLLIIEDELLTANRLRAMVLHLYPFATIPAPIPSIDASVRYLMHHEPDLIFMDIELADGQCFEIFHRINVECPVIFTTSYGEFAIQAFNHDSVGYLLKPLEEGELRKAMTKWLSRKRKMDIFPSRKVFNSGYDNTARARFKERFLVKCQQRLIPVRVDQVALFIAQNTLNFIMTKSGERFIVDLTLDQIQSLIDPGKFFRANRSVIIQQDVIQCVLPWFNGKLKLQTSLPLKDDVIVSKEKAPLLKAWLNS
jgi:two-component system response regulator LytT